jgi:acyl carrier protein
MDVKTRVKHYFIKVVGEDIGDEDDIFDLGFVNSLFAMQLVNFVEREFSITAEREDLVISNFSSIAALTDFVLKKLGRATDRQLGDGHPTD